MDVVARGATVVAGRRFRTGTVVVGDNVATPFTLAIGAIVVPAHSFDRILRTRPASLWSIDKPHRAFTATQLPRYSQMYERFGGNQFDGSRSLLLRFTESVTAINVRRSLMSFANRCLVAEDHTFAPLSQASLSATTWSMSRSDGSVCVTPS